MVNQTFIAQIVDRLSTGHIFFIADLGGNERSEKKKHV